MRSLLLAVAFAFFFVSSSFACDCNLPKSTEDHIDRTDVIFIGKAIRTRHTIGGVFSQLPFVGLYFDGPDRVTRFYVSEKMKGVKSDTISIFHNKHIFSNCGLNFEKNESYFIFASTDRPSKLHTSACHLTRNIRNYDVESIEAYRKAMSAH